MSDSKWQVLLPEEIDPIGPEHIDDIAEFTAVSEFGTEPEDLRPHIDAFHAIILRGAVLDASVIENATNLRIIAKHGAGLDNVDIDAATDNGTLVCNTPGANARAVAEHAVSMILAVRKNLRAADRNVRNGKWDRHTFINHEWKDDTLALFGYGDIASQVADLATGLGMDVVAYDPYVPESEFPETVTKIEETADLFRQADIVSVHVPLTAETRNAISTEELSLLAETDCIVNTSRGGVIDEDTLRAALEAGDIHGAGLDVLLDEPPRSDDPLLELENALFTPHLGGVTYEAMERMSLGAAKNVKTAYEGGVPESTVNPEAAER
jgi:D-3-phosphoglycerate dehydrogenase